MQVSKLLYPLPSAASSVQPTPLPCWGTSVRPAITVPLPLPASHSSLVPRDHTSHRKGASGDRTACTVVWVRRRTQTLLPPPPHPVPLGSECRTQAWLEYRPRISLEMDNARVLLLQPRPLAASRLLLCPAWLGCPIRALQAWILLVSWRIRPESHLWSHRRSLPSWPLLSPGKPPAHSMSPR